MEGNFYLDKTSDICAKLIRSVQRFVCLWFEACQALIVIEEELGYTDIVIEEKIGY
jgi:hypothetical protein